MDTDHTLPAGRSTGAVELLLVRHGESEANVAASAARDAGAEVIDVPARDPDVRLSPTGRDQAEALGRALATGALDHSPDVIFSSPYARARETADIAARTAALTVSVLSDERLRDRELGILDTLTQLGVQRRFPQEAERRRWLGKFYHRPPGGESWADVALRLRSVVAELNTLGEGQRVMVVCHDAVIFLFRYILEGLSEQEILDLAATNTVANASSTVFVRPSGVGPWELKDFNQTSHLSREGVTVTEHGGEANVQPQ